VVERRLVGKRFFGRLFFVGILYLIGLVILYNTEYLIQWICGKYKCTVFINYATGLYKVYRFIQNKIPHQTICNISLVV